MRHFSELSEDEVKEMWSACVDAAIEYAQSVDMGGLSHGKVHNLYVALENAIFGEWKKSRAVWGTKIDGKGEQAKLTE